MIVSVRFWVWLVVIKCVVLVLMVVVVGRVGWVRVVSRGRVVSRLVSWVRCMGFFVCSLMVCVV